MDMMSKTKGKLTISASVTRADGTVVNLGKINGRFPWRAWLYRFRVFIETKLNKEK